MEAVEDLDLNEIAVLLAAKNYESKSDISYEAMKILDTVFFAGSVLDRLVVRRLIRRRGLGRYELENDGLKAIANASKQLEGLATAIRYG